MKANEYFKKHGLENASAELNVFQSELAVNFGWDFVDELKSLVESHELIESFKCKRYSGISNAKDHLLTLAHTEDYEKLNKLKQAILDVESCQ